MKILHISRQRYDAIRSQGYGYKRRTSDETPKQYPDGDVTFHLMDSGREVCNDCGGEFESVKADTPAALEQAQWYMDTLVTDVDKFHRICGHEEARPYCYADGVVGFTPVAP